MSLRLFTFSVFLLLAAGTFVYSQSKSILEAETEIKTFQNVENFSVTHDDRKDLTSARVSINLREDYENLRKSFKKFSLEITSIYSGLAIEEKPFRSTFCVKTQSKGFKFANNNLLTLSVGNEEIRFGSPDRSSKVKGKKVWESLCWDITKKLVQEFGNASNIDLRIGSARYSIPAVKLQLLKDYSKLLSI